MLHKLATRFFIRRPVQGHGIMPYVERALQDDTSRSPGGLRIAALVSLAAWLLIIWFATGEYAPW